MATVFTSDLARTLVATLEKIITDGPLSSPQVMPKFMSQRSMRRAWEEDLEVGGPGLVPEKTEGSEIQLGSMREGFVTRYTARTYALKMSITEEIMEDGQYKDAIKLGQRLTRALMKSVDIHGTTLLMRGFNPDYPGGDGQPLWSFNHTLPHGGTFSNRFLVPMAPSRASVVIARTMAGLLPDHQGITEGYELKKVVFPFSQWAIWDEVCDSTKAPEAGEYNRINVVNQSMSLEKVPNKYWDAQTITHYAFMTDSDDGINFRWRRKPRSKTWVDNDHETMKHAVSARWAMGWSDARCSIGVEA